MNRSRRRVHVVDFINTVTALRYLIQLAKEGKLKGVVAIAEGEDGAYHAVMTETGNAAERIGRLEMVKDDILDAAREDRTELDSED